MIALFSVLFALSYLLPALASFVLWTQARRFKEYSDYLLASVLAVVAMVLLHIFVAISYLDPKLINSTGWTLMVVGWLIFTVLTMTVAINLPAMERKRRLREPVKQPIELRRVS